MLYNYFLSNNQKIIHKWVHYFPIYEKHFKRFVNQSLNFWEIGVYNGGSLQMWKRYFGPFAKIIGIDINPECKRLEEAQIEICIGDQSDTAFLQSIIDKHGLPDIVLDDGSHRMNHISTSFNFLYEKVSKNGVYMVEDLHTAYFSEYGGGLKRQGTFIEQCKDMIDSLNARHIRGESPCHAFANSTYSMSFYDSVVVFEKTEWTGDSLKSLIFPHIRRFEINNIDNNISIFTRKYKNEDFFIFCAGSYGTVVKHELQQENIPIIGYVDNEKDKQGSLKDGIEIISPEQSLLIPGRKYIIATVNENIITDVINQLTAMGVPKRDIYKIDANATQNP